MSFVFENYDAVIKEYSKKLIGIEGIVKITTFTDILSNEIEIMIFGDYNISSTTRITRYEMLSYYMPHFMEEAFEKYLIVRRELGYIPLSELKSVKGVFE